MLTVNPSANPVPGYLAWTPTGTPLSDGIVRVATHFSTEDFRALLGGRILALRVPNYYTPRLAHLMAKRLIAHPLFGHYNNAPDVGRVGTAFFETVENGVLREKYYAGAITAIHALREACLPLSSPVDLFRLSLEETWEWGATLANLDGRPMFVGLARVFEEGAEALPHQDILRRDAPYCPSAYGLLTQLAINVYLQPSPSGGELEIWQMRLTDAEYDALRLPESYGLDRRRLPEPDVVIRPEVGELILFDSTNVHAVRATIGGSRVTVSAFVGYRGPGQPLIYWS